MIKKIKILCVILSTCLCFSSCGFPSENTSEKLKNGEIVVKFLDVGQGDSELIFLPDNEVMLIDGGDTFCSEEIVAYLEDQGIEKIDYIVATHPHADHIGGLDDVLNSFEVEKIILPEIGESDIPSTVVYERLLNAITVNGCEPIRAEGGLIISDEENLEIKCLGPINSNYGDLNEYSAIIKLTYGRVSFLFMGDATDNNEKELLNIDADLDADVLKVGHHGSSTSTSDKFLDAVTPDYAIISVGEDNRYGHPHNETLTRISERKIKTYQTMDDGTIEMKCDGETVAITTTEDKIY